MRKINKIGFLILGVMLFFAIIFFTDALDMPNIYLVDKEVISFSDAWTWQGDGYQEKFNLPHYFDVDKSEPLVIRNTIPDDLPNGAKIALRVHMQSVIVKIDGETIYVAGDDSDKFLGEHFAKFWAVMDITPEHKGKTIEITLFSHLSASHGYASGPVIASGTGMLAHIFSEKGLGNVLSMLMIILGIIMVIVYFLGGIYKTGNQGFFYLSIFAMLMGSWFLGDSGILQLLTENTYYTTRITLISTLLSPIAFGLYMQETLPVTKKRFCDDFLLFLLVANAIVCFVLEFLDILGLRDTLQVSIILIAIFCIYYMAIFLIEIFYYKNKKASKEAKAIFIFMFFAIMETVQFNVSGQKASSSYMLIGITIYIILSLINRMRDYQERIKEKEYFEKVAYTDALTGGCNRAGYIRDLAGITNPKGITFVQADTDRLKYINDYFGHSHGDQAIIDTYNILNKHFSPIGQVYRIGGDEFSVIIKNVNRIEINRVIKQMKEETDLIADNRVYDFSISTGIAEYDTSLDADIHATAVRADHKMYEDKKRLRNTVPQKMPIV